jgi:hypothetical protein
MFQVACSCLCIPAGSTPSERLFRQADLLSSHRFSRTTPNNLDLNVLAKLNIKKGSYVTAGQLEMDARLSSLPAVAGL